MVYMGDLYVNCDFCDSADQPTEECLVCGTIFCEKCKGKHSEHTQEEVQTAEAELKRQGVHFDGEEAKE